MRLQLDCIMSPIGEVLLACDAEGRLRALDFHDYEHRMRQLLRLHYGAFELVSGPAPDAVTAPLRAYFAGRHGDSPFLDVVPFRFKIADPARHYHLPLKITLWGFSLFRGA